MAHVETGEKLFEVFDPVNDISPVCERFTNDPRLLKRMVESIYGEPACLFKEKLIFKPPGALGYNLHQDIPRTWAGFPRTFLTVLIPIDRSTQENGCTEIFSGYHHEFMAPPDRPDLYMLPADSVDPARRVRLVLEPGDVAIFHGLTPHRSDPNRSSEMRRVFYVSYNARSDGRRRPEKRRALPRISGTHAKTAGRRTPGRSLRISAFFRTGDTAVEYVRSATPNTIAPRRDRQALQAWPDLLRLGNRRDGRPGDAGHASRTIARAGHDHRTAHQRPRPAPRSSPVRRDQFLGNNARCGVLPALWQDSRPIRDSDHA